MANVDYVVATGAPLTEVIAKARLATGAWEVGENRLHTSDDRVELRVYPSGSEVVVEIYLAGTLAERRDLSQRIYHYLVANTDCNVALDSDDADRTITSRTVTRV